MIKSKQKQGFTLIELLVVITIVGVLSVIGMTLYSGVQARARDAKRSADIEALSKTLEANYSISTGLYQKPTASQFAGGGLPEDPKATGSACSGAAGNFLYCIYIYDGTGTVVANGPLTSASIPATFVRYTTCAHLENAGTGNSYDAQGLEVSAAGTKDFFCRKNQQ